MNINGYDVVGRMPPFTRENRALVRSGVKTQTRRVVKPQPSNEFFGPEEYTSIVFDRNYMMIPGKMVYGIYGDDWGIKCPYGRPGDIRVMTEPLHRCLKESVCYDDYRGVKDEGGRDAVWQWKRYTLSSMFMPIWAGRTVVRYTRIWVERLWDISTNDVRAEGIDLLLAEETRNWNNYATGSVYKDAYAKLWDSINGKAHPWSSNPWVWVIEWELLS